MLHRLLLERRLFRARTYSRFFSTSASSFSALSHPISRCNSTSRRTAAIIHARSDKFAYRVLYGRQKCCFRDPRESGICETLSSIAIIGQVAVNMWQRFVADRSLIDYQSGMPIAYIIFHLHRDVSITPLSRVSAMDTDFDWIRPDVLSIIRQNLISLNNKNILFVLWKKETEKTLNKYNLKNINI